MRISVFDNFSVIEDIDEKRVNVILWDTAGQEDYVAVRRICYEQTAVYFLCFSLVHPNSFHNIKSKWLPELKQYAPNATLFLIGTKTDLLEDKATLKELKELNEEPISQKQAVALQKEIGAHLYLTCSGKDVASVNKVFRDALHFLLDREKKQLEKEKKQWKKELKELQQIEKELAKLRLEQQKQHAANAAAANNNNNNHSATSTSTSTNKSNNDDNDDDDDESADSDAPAQPTTTAPDDDDGSGSGSGGKRHHHHHHSNNNHANNDDDDDDDSPDDADRPATSGSKVHKKKKKAAAK